MTMRALVLGGTRHIGRAVVEALAAAGARVTRLHRGQTDAPLPRGADDRRADRTDPMSLAFALGDERFDLVVDTLVWNATDALLAHELLRDRVGRYVAIGTGQVYLVRRDVRAPFREDDAAGPLQAEPASEYDRGQWRYGVEKREAEAVLEAAAADGFPVTILRLPMVHGPFDPYRRLQQYLWRIRDGQPLLLPADEPWPVLRHVDVRDVATAVLRVAEVAPAPGRAFNIGAATGTSLEQVLERVAQAAGRPWTVRHVPRAVLEAGGFLPGCGPFSQRWMSALDSTRAQRELGLRPRALEASLDDLLPGLLAEPHPPAGLTEARRRELALLSPS